MGTRGVTWTRLKWLTIVLPVSFLVLLHYLLHNGLYEFHDFPQALILLPPVLLAIAAFSLGVFRIITVLEDRVVVKNRELKALLAVGSASAAALELPQVLDRALPTILEATSADVAEIWLSGEGAMTLEARAGSGPDRSHEGATAHRLAVTDPSDASQLAETALTEAGFRSSCALPLRHGGTTLGVLALAARDERELCGSPGGDRRLLEGIAERLAIAIENARLHEQVLDGAVVEERARIGRELHDNLGQLLGYLNTQTLAVRKLVASGRTADAEIELAAMNAATRQLNTDLRVAIAGLRLMPHPERLAASVPRYAHAFAELTGASVDVRVSEDAGGIRLPPYAELQLLRIVQEALTNVSKHADPNRATIVIDTDAGHLRLRVTDLGPGFDVARARAAPSPSFGLETMQERAESIGARFSVHSGPREGTTILVELPLTQPEAPAAPPTRASVYASVAG